MSLDVYIKFKEPRKENYFLNHPYSYSNLSKGDEEAFHLEETWHGNITHNLNEMANHIPIKLKDRETTLYYICWRPEELFETPTTDLVLEGLLQGIWFMIYHRKELLKYNSPNGWGTYDGFMKFLLNYKQACEDNPDCIIEADR